MTALGDWALRLRRLPRPALPADPAAGADRWRAWLDADAVGPTPRLRPRSPGDRFQPLGLAGHVTVKEFMIDSRLPRAARAGWPLLVGDCGIAWLPGLRIAQPAAIRPTTAAVYEATLRPTSPGDANP